jgi:hypothetical protein
MLIAGLVQCGCICLYRVWVARYPVAIAVAESLSVVRPMRKNAPPMNEYAGRIQHMQQHYQTSLSSDSFMSFTAYRRSISGVHQVISCMYSVFKSKRLNRRSVV